MESKVGHTVKALKVPPIIEVAVVGNIGVGKTDLVKEAGRRHGWDIHLRSEETENPWFPPSQPKGLLRHFQKGDEYKPFHSQMWFATDELREYLDQRRWVRSAVWILDHYPGMESIEVYAWALAEQGVLDDDEWQLFQAVSEIWKKVVPLPDLLVHLRKPVDILLRQQEGGSEKEKISFMDLARLQKIYGALVESFPAPRISIDVDHLDPGNPATFDIPLKTIYENVELLYEEKIQQYSAWMTSKNRMG